MPPTARLREAGAIVLAKTTVPSFGTLSSGLSGFHGVTRNPRDLVNNTGGSSSGAAAAAAADYEPLHLDTDIGDSVRLPANWCGLVGFKPSLRRIPIDPYYTGRCADPMTRYMDDYLLLIRYLAQPDACDATGLPPEALGWSAEPLSVRGLRVDLQLNPGCGLQPDAEIRTAVEAAAQLFEEHDAQLGIVEPPMDRSLLDSLSNFWRTRLWSELLLLDETRRARVLPYVHAQAGDGARVNGVDTIHGLSQISKMRRRAARLFGEIDLLLTPTNQVEAFPTDWASPPNDPQRPFEHIVSTMPWNMGEQPALSINCGFTAAGMLVGLQLIVPRFADTWLLRIDETYRD